MNDGNITYEGGEADTYEGVEVTHKGAKVVTADVLGTEPTGMLHARVLPRAGKRVYLEAGGHEVKLTEAELFALAIEAFDTLVWLDEDDDASNILNDIGEWSITRGGSGGGHTLNLPDGEDWEPPATYIVPFRESEVRHDGDGIPSDDGEWITGYRVTVDTATEQPLTLQTYTVSADGTGELHVRRENELAEGLTIAEVRAVIGEARTNGAQST
jgi:hypothetical protein